MKKALFILMIFCIIVISGCTNYKKEAELLKEQNILLQKEQDLAKEQEQVKEQTKEQVQTSIDKAELFNKQIECQKYKADVEKQFNFKAQISVFYSTYANTCLYENIFFENGQIKSRSIAEIFGTRGYIVEQNGGVIYAKEEFGANKTYADIEKILKGIKY